MSESAMATGSGMFRSDRANATAAPTKKNRMAGDVKSEWLVEKSGMGRSVR